MIFQNTELAMERQLMHQFQIDAQQRVNEVKRSFKYNTAF